MMAQIYIDERIRWRARIFEVHFGDEDDVDDKTVHLDELFCFLKSDTSISEYYDDMPWSAVSSPYLVNESSVAALDMLADIHARWLQNEVNFSDRFVCEKTNCKKPCCASNPARCSPQGPRGAQSRPDVSLERFGHPDVSIEHFS